MDTRILLFSATKKDFRIDTFCAGGPGGQNQNKRETGVRIVHIPTGISAESRETRSQWDNKRRAFRRLAQLLVRHVTQQHVKLETSKETIRTYHFPDQRVKDHASGFVQRPAEVLDDPSAMIAARRSAVK